MKKCINYPSILYTGKEDSPKGRGYCARGETIGTIKRGRDRKMWIVKKDSINRKRWAKVSKKSNIKKEKKKSAKRKVMKGGNPETNAVAAESSSASYEGQLARAGWEILYDSDGDPYYYCIATGISHWELPELFEFNYSTFAKNVKLGILFKYVHNKDNDNENYVVVNEVVKDGITYELINKPEDQGGYPTLLENANERETNVNTINTTVSKLTCGSLRLIGSKASGKPNINLSTFDDKKKGLQSLMAYRDEEGFTLVFEFYKEDIDLIEEEEEEEDEGDEGDEGDEDEEDEEEEVEEEGEHLASIMAAAAKMKNKRPKEAVIEPQPVTIKHELKRIYVINETDSDGKNVIDSDGKNVIDDREFYRVDNEEIFDEYVKEGGTYTTHELFINKVNK